MAMASNLLLNALITARGGSKRLPNKNLKYLCGKPLIVWTIEAAKQSEFINKIYVSTDSSEIGTIAQRSGAIVPRLRPMHLATDTANSIDTVLDFAEYFEYSNRKEILLLQPTSPLRQSKDIDNMMEKVRNKSLKQCYSVKNISKFLTLAGIEINESNSFVPNGSMYYSELDILCKEKTFFSDKSEKYLMDDFHSIDIDTQDDWNIAEACLKHKFEI